MGAVEADLQVYTQTPWSLRDHGARIRV